MTKKQSGFSAVEVILVVLVLGLVGVIGWLVWSKNSAPTNTQSSTQTKSVEIPEIGVKIADPENRGLAVYYDDSAKEPCLTNKDYYVNNGCNKYLTSTHCKDDDLTDGSACMYYIYDNTTYKPGSNTSENAAAFAKYFQCDSDLVIYQTKSEDANQAATDYTATFDVDGKTIALWGHGTILDSSCNDADSAKTDAYIKDLLQYVKKNTSAL